MYLYFMIYSTNSKCCRENRPMTGGDPGLWMTSFHRRGNEIWFVGGWSQHRATLSHAPCRMKTRLEIMITTLVYELMAKISICRHEI